MDSFSGIPLFGLHQLVAHPANLKPNIFNPFEASKSNCLATECAHNVAALGEEPYIRNHAQ